MFKKILIKRIKINVGYIMFYIFAWSMGVIFAIIATILYKMERINKFMWHMFWIGFGLGCIWEFGLSIANELYIFTDYPWPASVFNTPRPVEGVLAIFVIGITHSLWDGALFWLCVLFVNLICKEPYFEKFNWKELFVLLIIGQIQEFFVELTSNLNNAWELYLGPDGTGTWYNIPLFYIGGKAITLLPQLIWVAAPIAFYFIVLKLKPRFSDTKLFFERNFSLI
ncbi:MAG: hypothetical protein ACTSUT_08455 [Promethearchaeota archaeon]